MKTRVTGCLERSIIPDWRGVLSDGWGLLPVSAGLMVFFRGFVNYLKVRNMSENMASSHRTRFFFLC